MTSKFSGFVSGLTQAGKQISEQVQSQVERHRNPDGSVSPGEQGHGGRTSSTTQGGGGAFASLKTTMRQGFVEYDPRQSAHTLKLQLAIRAQRGCVTDHESIARDSQIFSKALVGWGEQQPELDEVKDESDRIAYLLYKTGEAHSSYATSLEQSRSALKDLRNFESKLNQRRDKRVELQKKIDQLTIAHAKQPKHGQEIESLQHELGQLKQEDAAEEAAVEAMKKQKLREGFKLQFEALQKLGEQLALIGSHGQALVSQPYDAARAGQIKSAAQSSLDSWSTSRSFTPQVQLGAPGLERHDTTSFASTHSAELARIKLDDHSTAHQSYYDAPRTDAASVHSTQGVAGMPTGQATNIHPTSSHDVPMSSPPLPAGGSLPGINMQPTPLTHPSSPPQASAPLRETPSSDSTSSLSHMPSDPVTSPAGPTVAETGVPLGGDPGPKSGQLPARRTSTSAQSEAARRKQEEARQELRNNFEGLQGGPGPSSAGPSGQQEYLPAYEEPRLQ